MTNTRSRRLTALAAKERILEAMEKRLEDAERYEKVLEAIKSRVDYDDWVQDCCREALDGRWPKCWICGAPVHSGRCMISQREALQRFEDVWKRLEAKCAEGLPEART